MDQVEVTVSAQGFKVMTVYVSQAGYQHSSLHFKLYN